MEEFRILEMQADVNYLLEDLQEVFDTIKDVRIVQGMSKLLITIDDIRLLLNEDKYLQQIIDNWSPIIIDNFKEMSTNGTK